MGLFLCLVLLSNHNIIVKHRELSRQGQPKTNSHLSLHLNYLGVADLRYESSFMGFLKPRLKLTFGYVQN
jgi:hypothetical protein